MSKGNILITGVSTGIGYYSAKKFIDNGYTVYGSVRKLADADRVAAELGAAFHPLLFDVTDHDAIKKAAKQLTEEIGTQGLQCLINNSGIALSGTVEFLDISSYKYQFDVNFFGMIAVTQAFLPLLGTMNDCPFPSGKIINMSSIAGKTCMPFMTPYSTSKAAVDSLTEGLRRELMVYGIDVICMNPGPIETPIWEKAQAPPEELMQTKYAEAIRNFYKFFINTSKQAIKVEDFANKVFKNFKSKRPKTTEVMIKGKFFKYTVPNHLLSARQYDGIIRRILKM